MTVSISFTGHIASENERGEAIQNALRDAIQAAVAQFRAAGGEGTGTFTGPAGSKSI